MGIDAWIFTQPESILLHIESIKQPFQVFGYLHFPGALLCFCQGIRLFCTAALSFCVEHHSHIVCSRSPQRENGLCRRIVHLHQFIGAHRILLERGIFLHLLLLASCQCCQRQSHDYQTIMLHISNFQFSILNFPTLSSDSFARSPSSSYSFSPPWGYPSASSGSRPHPAHQ